MEPDVVGVVLPAAGYAGGNSKGERRNRKLGIPTVSDRIAQTVVKLIIEPKLDPVFHEDSYGYRPGNRRNRRLQSRENGAGSTTGSSSLISRRRLTKSIMRLLMKAVRRHIKEAGSCCISSGG